MNDLKIENKSFKGFLFFQVWMNTFISQFNTMNGIYIYKVS